MSPLGVWLPEVGSPTRDLQFRSPPLTGMIHRWRVIIVLSPPLAVAFIAVQQGRFGRVRRLDRRCSGWETGSAQVALDLRRPTRG